jgi:hypothetical protein
MTDMDEMDQLLKQWITSICGPVQVSFAAPRREEEGEGVGLYLMELVNAPPGRGTRLPPLKVSLRYLLTTWSAQPAKAHRLLGQLMFAALENKECEVELEPLPAAVWQAFGVPPRPCFVMRVPFTRERVEKRAPLVRQQLIVHQSPMRPLHGRVVGPGDVPIMGAQVTLPALNLAVRTDFNGHFRFAAVPTQPPITKLRVSARGKEVAVPIDPRRAFTAEAPLLIQLKETDL